MANREETSNPKDNESLETLVDAFRCLICQEKVKDAHLCPYCSKLCCYECIRCWLGDYDKKHCPNCRADLQLHELVKCRWIESVTQQLDTLKRVPRMVPREVDSENGRCAEHREELRAYCETCKKGLCCQCEPQHPAGHTSKPLDEAFEEHRSQMNGEVVQLKQRQSELQSLINEVDRKEERVKAAKEKRVSDIMNAVRLVLDLLDAELRDKLSVLMCQKNLLKSEDERIMTLLEKINLQLQSRSKLDLISQTSEFSQEKRQIFEAPMSSLIAESVSANFQSGSQFQTPTTTTAVPSVSSPMTSQSAGATSTAATSSSAGVTFVSTGATSLSAPAPSSSAGGAPVNSGATSVSSELTSGSTVVTSGSTVVTSASTVVTSSSGAPSVSSGATSLSQGTSVSSGVSTATTGLPSVSTGGTSSSFERLLASMVATTSTEATSPTGGTSVSTGVSSVTTGPTSVFTRATSPSVGRATVATTSTGALGATSPSRGTSVSTGVSSVASGSIFSTGATSGFTGFGSCQSNSYSSPTPNAMSNYQSRDTSPVYQPVQYNTVCSPVYTPSIKQDYDYRPSTQRNDSVFGGCYDYRPSNGWNDCDYDYKTPSVSKKHLAFVSEPIRGKSVTDLPGIGATLGGRLADAGLSKASDINKQFARCKNVEDFQKYMKNKCGANAKQSRDCYNALSQRRRK